MTVLDPKLPQPAKVDEKAPELLELIIKDKLTGDTLFTNFIKFKHFSTGSVGYNCSGKMTNPESGEKYHISCNITLVGYKPEK
jgi:hypothetical protein